MVCSASGDSHLVAAQEFYAVSKIEDPDTAGRLVARLFTNLDPSLKRHEDILFDYARELVVSDRYADAHVKVYKESFSEEELWQLTIIFSSPIYKTYRARRLQLVQRTTAETMAIFKDSLPELMERVRANTPDTQN